MPPKRAGGRGSNLPTAQSGQQSLAHAVALHQSGDLTQARAIYDRVLRSQPRSFDALHLAGVASAQSGDPERAVALIGRAIAVKADHAPAHHHLGLALAALGRFDAALASYDRAIALAPDNSETHNDRGNALADLGRMQEAVQSYDRAIALLPNFAEAHYNRGCALAALSRMRAALESYDRALALRADYARAWNNRGVALDALGQIEAALPCFESATAIAPDYADAVNNQAFALSGLKRYSEALERFDALLALRPDYPCAAGARLRTQMAIANWHDFDSRRVALVEGIERGERVARPFDVLAISDSPTVLRSAARTWIEARCQPDPALGPLPVSNHQDRIRIGYFSPDFRNHALAALTAELFERHDRSRFEIYGFSFGPDDGSEMRRRVVSAFDRFIDVRERSDADVAQLARSLAIDIAVDLAGFTHGARTGIFALRAAHVQASWLGFLGTMSAEYIDYLIADAAIVPDALRDNYAEKIVRLPSYQPNDTKRAIAEPGPTRSELGLPSAGIVFCSFNDTYKLTPGMFDRWMRILRRAVGSVLFLYADNDVTGENLRREAGARGVAPERLVFGGRLPAPDYIARYRVADLVLDTLPYNGGVTSSDALWAGVPVLTCTGDTFASRVGACLLRAVGLDELIAASPEAYEELAVALAAAPDRIASLRRRLAENRMAAPLFDTVSHTTSLEAAYAEMLRRSRAGLRPDHIDVEL